jgi:hypothetical protein
METNETTTRVDPRTLDFFSFKAEGIDAEGCPVWALDLGQGYALKVAKWGEDEDRGYFYNLRLFGPGMEPQFLRGDWFHGFGGCERRDVLEAVRGFVIVFNDVYGEN